LKYPRLIVLDLAESVPELHQRTTRSQKKPRSRGATRVDDGLVPFASTTTVGSPRVRRPSTIQCSVFVCRVREQWFVGAEMLPPPPPCLSPTSRGRESSLTSTRSRESAIPTLFPARRESECLHARRVARSAAPLVGMNPVLHASRICCLRSS